MTWLGWEQALLSISFGEGREARKKGSKGDQHQSQKKRRGGWGERIGVGKLRTVHLSGFLCFIHFRLSPMIQPSPGRLSEMYRILSVSHLKNDVQDPPDGVSQPNVIHCNGAKTTKFGPRVPNEATTSASSTRARNSTGIKHSPSIKQSTKTNQCHHTCSNSDSDSSSSSCGDPVVT